MSQLFLYNNPLRKEEKRLCHDGINDKVALLLYNGFE